MATVQAKRPALGQRAACVESEAFVRFDQPTKPILKGRTSLSAPDESGADRRSASCASRRKNSIVCEAGAGGSDRRRSRSVYSVGKAQR